MNGLKNEFCLYLKTERIVVWIHIKILIKIWKLVKDGAILLRLCATSMACLCLLMT